MPDAVSNIAHCPACGKTMDVTKVAPFSGVLCPRCGEKTRVKREFGPYTLLRRHAIGGMSVVFIAHDNTLDREVALKILNEDYSANEKRIAAFEEEARITASISHPHVVRVFTTGRAFDRFYIAMELVSGGHLEHQIRERGVLPECELLTLAIQIAEGLQAAHAVGLIHRDIKPGNILLDAAGNAKIVDFGLALVTQGGKAKADEFWATPYYVPPEAIDGLAEDFRSDIYAFGATLYHALAGKPPCDEESMVTTVLRQAKRHIPPLKSVAPGLHEETCAVIDRAMAFEPSGRFQSYEELLAALKYALLRAEGGEVPQESVAERRRRQAKRRERFWMAAAGGMLLSTIAAVILIVTRPVEPPPPRPADQVASVVEMPTGQDTVDPAAAARIGARYREARAALERGDLKRAQEEFSAVRDSPEVQEPTGTWAGIEAVIAALADGRGDDARAEAERSLAHVRETDAGFRALRNALSPALEGIDRWSGPPGGGLVPEKATAPEMMAWMLYGLKEWEQGRWTSAARFFEAVKAVKLRESEAWLRLYQQIARNYLDDRALLEPLMPAGTPVDAAACREKREALDRAVGLLKTRGRTRFNVRVWQLEWVRLEREWKDRPAPPPPEPPKWAEIRAETDRLCRGFRFEEAVGRLKTADVKPADQRERDALLALVESAATLLPTLEGDLRGDPVAANLPAGDGSTVFATVVSPAPGRLKVADAAGNAREIGWHELPPSSINDLHRLLVKNAAGEADRLRRHEAAIAFEWLVGDRDRAKAAADRLAKDHEAFRRRWEGISSALK